MIGDVVSTAILALLLFAAPAVAFAQPAAKIPRIGLLGFSAVHGQRLEAFRQGLREGGNITGLSLITPALSGKRLELLKEVVPKLSRIGVLSNPADPPRVRDVTELKAAAETMRIAVTTADARVAGDFDAAFATVAAARPQALIVFSDPVLFTSAGRIIDFAARNRLPTMYGQETFVVLGGLMTFGASFEASFHRAAYYVDRILKGAKPADLPIEQPTKFELVINARTAKTLGITFPPSLLLRVDRVID